MRNTFKGKCFPSRWDKEKLRWPWPANLWILEVNPLIWRIKLTSGLIFNQQSFRSLSRKGCSWERQKSLKALAMTSIFQNNWKVFRNKNKICILSCLQRIQMKTGRSIFLNKNKLRIFKLIWVLRKKIF